MKNTPLFKKIGHNYIDVIDARLVKPDEAIKILKIRNAILQKHISQMEEKLKERNKQIEMCSDVMIELEEKNQLLSLLNASNISLN